MKQGTREMLWKNAIKRPEPAAESVYIEKRPSFGPSIVYINALDRSAVQSAN